MIEQEIAREHQRYGFAEEIRGVDLNNWKKITYVYNPLSILIFSGFISELI